MKNCLKFIKNIFILFSLIFALFIIEESFRLLFIKKLSDPSVVFEEKYSYDSSTYDSLGFTFRRTLDCKSDDLCFVDGLEFWLFNKIPIKRYF